TAVLVAGITLGPTVYSCAQGDDFGSCFSQSLFDDGATAPAPAPMAAAPSGPEQEIPARAERGTETAAETAAPVLEAEPGDAGVGPASLPQQQESADPEPEAVPAPPSVDLVRVEPDGSAVIAGNASSGAVVELYANDALIGDETADTGGAW